MVSEMIDGPNHKCYLKIDDYLTKALELCELGMTNALAKGCKKSQEAIRRLTGLAKEMQGQNQQEYIEWLADGAFIEEGPQSIDEAVKLIAGERGKENDREGSEGSEETDHDEAAGLQRDLATLNLDWLENASMRPSDSMQMIEPSKSGESAGTDAMGVDEPDHKGTYLPTPEDSQQIWWAIMEEWATAHCRREKERLIMCHKHTLWHIQNHDCDW